MASAGPPFDAYVNETTIANRVTGTFDKAVDNLSCRTDAGCERNIDTKNNTEGGQEI